MSLTRRSLLEAAAARFGWRRAYGETTQVEALLTEQAENAYTAAADHAAQAIMKNTTALAVQPGVLNARVLVLDEVLYLEGLLVGARNRRLPQELIERLEDAVDHGHELTVLLADTVRATAAHPAGH
ncbi:hypothetical protein ACWC5C_38735 [Streptomyces sp. NPDC001700]